MQWLLLPCRAKPVLAPSRPFVPRSLGRRGAKTVTKLLLAHVAAHLLLPLLPPLLPHTATTATANNVNTAATRSDLPDDMTF